MAAQNGFASAESEEINQTTHLFSSPYAIEMENHKSLNIPGWYADVPYGWPGTIYMQMVFAFFISSLSFQMI